jgi:hypothetical protein
MTFNSKTTCFTIAQMPLTIAKDAFLESKTSCFVVRDGSDRLARSITWYNQLILSRLEESVTD